MQPEGWDGIVAPYKDLTLHGGGTIVERLEDKDDKKRTYTYSILEGPLPVAGYKARRRAPGARTQVEA